MAAGLIHAPHRTKLMTKLKIVVVGAQFPDSFARNVSVSLEHMGHLVTNVSTSRAYHNQNRVFQAFWIYAPRAFPLLERVAYDKLVKTVAANQPDLVLLTQGLPPQVLKRLSEVSASKLVCWFTDPVANFYRGYLIAGSYDAIFVKESHIVPLLRDKLGLNAHYLPEACNPLWHTAITLSESDRREFGCDLAAIGSLHYYRARMLEQFVSYDLKIWGNACPSWVESPTRAKYQHRLVAEQSKAKAVRAAQIVVNTMNYAEIEGVNCTLFETAGCGGFQITDLKPTLPSLFEPEREIVTFQSRAELKEKVDFYLAHPQERFAIAERAYKRAHKDHTYEQRLRAMFSVLGLAGKDTPAQNSNGVEYRNQPCLVGRR
jgi:spore maturation protein CgeB